MARPKGSVNKSTEKTRIVLATFLERNIDGMQDLYEEIKKDDPKAAFDTLFKGIEYILPKLARVEGKQDITISLAEKLADME